MICWCLSKCSPQYIVLSDDSIKFWKQTFCIKDWLHFKEFAVWIFSKPKGTFLKGKTTMLCLNFQTHYSLSTPSIFLAVPTRDLCNMPYAYHPMYMTITISCTLKLIKLCHRQWKTGIYKANVLSCVQVYKRPQCSRSMLSTAQLQTTSNVEHRKYRTSRPRNNLLIKLFNYVYKQRHIREEMTACKEGLQYLPEN